MSLLYKSSEERNFELVFHNLGREVSIDIWSNIGKHGTMEPVAEWNGTHEELAFLLFKDIQKKDDSLEER